MSRGATARLFVALDPPVWVGEELAAWTRGLAADARREGSSHGALRVLDADSLHLTLCFLGSRPVAEIEPLTEVLGGCEEPACELSVGAPLLLPPRRPRALAVEIRDRQGELTAVQERISGALAAVTAWQPERRRFRPHITLARMRGAPRRERGAPTDAASPVRDARKQPLAATPPLSFTPEAIVLYRSWLAPEGASYEALASSELSSAVR